MQGFFLTMTNTTTSVPTPKWIDATFVEEALLNSGEKAALTGFKTETGTAPGDNYSSLIFRVKAALDDGSEKSFVIKTVLYSEEIVSRVDQSSIFNREGSMLYEIIPQIEALLEEAAPGRWTQLAPRCPMYSDDPDIYIVMEDLRSQGFRLADRKRGLGLRHCLLAIRSLARFHAASHLLIQKDPSLITRFDSVYPKQKDVVNTFMQCSVQAAVDACKTWPGFEDEVMLLEKLKPTITDQLIELHEPRPHCFNVITHGDFWTNNMMFRYDEDGRPCDHRMFDLQVSHVASPALDLLYFVTTSLSEDVSIHHQDLLIREYYFTLKEVLTLQELEVPSFETLLADMDAHGLHSFFGTVSVTPIVKAETVPDMSAIITGDHSSLCALYNIPEVKKFLQRMIPELKRRGWLPAGRN